MRKWIVFLAIAAFGLGPACSGPLNHDDSAVEQDDDSGKADGVTRPVGAYEADSVPAGSVSRLVLRSDKTYHVEIKVVCVAAPCNPVGSDGAYKFTKGGNTRYVRLLDEEGGLRHRFAYKLSGETLSLRDTEGSGRWVDLARDATGGWCEDSSECALQNLVQPRCIGSWSCLENTCSYRCAEFGCLFGETFAGLLETAGFTTLSEKLFTGQSRLTEIQKLQIVDAVNVTYEVSDTAGAFAAVDEGEIVYRKMLALTSQKEFEVFDYGAGDNTYGAIFYAGTTKMAAEIHDGDLTQCIELSGPDLGDSCAGVEPGDGGESEPCSQSDQCDGRQYCNLSLCRCYPPGECQMASDCSNPGNDWIHIECLGEAACENGLCTWSCS